MSFTLHTSCLRLRTFTISHITSKTSQQQQQRSQQLQLLRTRQAARMQQAGVPPAASSSMASGASGSGKTKVLFVCLGNICRSPTAEAVFQAVVDKAGVATQFEIDRYHRHNTQHNCGTGGGSANWYLPGGFSYHEGDPADPRMTSVASNRGVTLTSRSRPLRPGDLSEFDYIIGMDASNLQAIRRAAEHWRAKEGHPVPEDWEAKLGLMTNYLQQDKWRRYNEVPDPYWSGRDGFELVLDLLEDACEGLLVNIQNGGSTTRS